jgi:hypothetical protein
VIVCAPEPKVEVVNEQVPAASNGTWASTTVPSWNVTIPDGFVAPAGTGATVAVKVTAWPGFDGFGEELTVDVEALA